MFYSILKAHPYDVQIQDLADGIKMVAVAIARDHEENRIVSVVCEFAKASIDGQIHWEFSFGIDVIALDGSIEPFRTQERQMAAPFIPHDIRAEVMNVVCEGLKCLISGTKPDLVYWVTKDRNVPEKGMRKYHMLMETLVEMGYSLWRQGTDLAGRRFFSMRQNLD